MCRKNVKYDRFVAIRCAFSSSKYSKPRFRPGLRALPDPARGAYDAPPDPLVSWGGGQPLPIPFPLDAFGVSISAPSVVSAPTHTNSLLRLCMWPLIAVIGGRGYLGGWLAG